MLKFTFCPTFSIVSFIFFITIVDIIVYIATLIGTGVSGQYLDSQNFLGPSGKTLDNFGEKNGYKMRYLFQMWRWFTPMLLHAGFIHIFVLFYLRANLEYSRICCLR
jgi:membrane associated rhomboid family serine protease